VPEETYTIEAPNQRLALQEASRKGREDGIDPLRVKVLSSEPLFEWGDPRVRCIVLVQGPKIDS
jgi:hypothetical protein